MAGDTVSGVLEAPSEHLALEKLKANNLIVLSLGEKSTLFSSQLAFLQRITHKEMVIFTRQLAVTLSAGVPLAQALELVMNQMTNEKLIETVANIVSQVRSGIRFSVALAAYQNLFNEFFINMVRAGETSGKLDEVLNYLADQMERNYELTSKIRGAMIYPAFVMGFAIVISVLMLVFVVPKLAEIISESGARLPLPTQILITTSKYVKDYFLLFFTIAILIGVGIRFFFKSDIGKHVYDVALLKTPVFGSLARKIYLVRFTKSLSTLIVGGVPLNASLRIVGSIVGNSVYKQIINNTVEAVEAGNSISSVFINSREIPVILSQVMKVGEETGRLDEVLNRMGNFFNQELEVMLSRLTVLLEPLIIVILGLGVGFIAVSLIIPIYNLAQSFG